ncbi:DUF3078 domain-containing protein [Salinibacter ruber]|jgi:hypothetical protein|uniref:DUF3078 domain-containing protein n=3 Tax=Salinibacter ruber TaxID=146919 RepID=Q2S1T3_SALRD|nr:DUF3078 domain-containing protein [Salinibacter ruber]ABC45215.1 hypothetical protein SRU_1730 [Salinibacter ruber DSM 13855]CBH24862.1 conserved hypothetical protein, secreted [Salinibacter ruber M8]MCS3659127.1 hypothetical protein [Salinibacter ruber]MCS4033729.1 hypothetical protein [Salinibacter ruber]MCS4137235.1 hypothetical protein [Salinibacter ruber]
MPYHPISSALAVLCLFLVGLPVSAQPGLPSLPNPQESPTSDTADAEWDSELTGKISVSQAAYRNWQEGGVNSLSFTTSLDGATERKGDRWAQAYTARFALGYINQEDQEVRKAEDRIRLQANLQYQGDGFFNTFSPTLAGDLRTQFAPGFAYSDNPYEDEAGVDPNNPRIGEDPPVRTSSFFAPGTVTESIGLTYDPLDPLSLRLGVAAKQTVVAEPDFRVLYGVDPDNLVRSEAGGQFSANLDQQLSESIRYRSQLDVFFAVNQLDNPPDAVWDNVINLQVNDWITTDLEFVALFDEDTSSAIQIREAISVGVSFTLL